MQFFHLASIVQEVQQDVRGLLKNAEFQNKQLEKLHATFDATEKEKTSTDNSQD